MVRIHPPPPRRRKLPIACGGFLIRRSLISLRLLSPQSRRAALRGPRFGRLPIACGSFKRGLLIFNLRMGSKGPPKRTCRWHVRRPVAFPQKSESILLHHVAASFLSLAALLSGGCSFSISAWIWAGRIWRERRGVGAGQQDHGDRTSFLKIETAVLFRPLRYHVRRPKSSAGADIVFAIFCKCAGKTDRLPLGCCTPAGVRCRIYKGFTLFPLTGRSAGSMMEKTPLEGRL